MVYFEPANRAKHLRIASGIRLCAALPLLKTWHIAKALRVRGSRSDIGHLLLEANLKSILCVSLLILLTPSAYAALPGDSADGKRLHDANCMGCHDTGIYTRKDRLVLSLDALKKQLGSCSHMAKKRILRD